MVGSVGVGLRFQLALGFGSDQFASDAPDRVGRDLPEVDADSPPCCRDALPV
jgi:hypothetical protein